MELKFEVHAKIQKPLAEVFDAVYNPEKLSRYFATGGASAYMKEGTTVMWSFADVPQKYGASEQSFPVKVTRVEQERLIVFDWAASDGDYDTTVKITFQSLGPSETQISISESGWKDTPSGLASSYDNCGGWMQMLSCLKGYLEYGINLRKGFN